MNDSPKQDRLLRALGLSFIAAVLYVLAFPPFDLAYLAILAPLPIALMVLDPRRPLPLRSALAAGLLFGWLTSLGVTGSWIFHAATEFFDSSTGLSLAFTAFVTFVHVALFLAAIVVFSSRLWRLPPLWRAAALASVWVTFEFARSHRFYGCPWDLLGHAFYRYPLLIQASDLGGVWVLSWAAVAFSALLATALIEREQKGILRRCVGLAVILPLVLVAYGYYALSREAAQQASRSEIEPLRVGLVQANVGRHALWRPSLQMDHLERYIELSRSPELDTADLIVWPESSVPFFLESNPEAAAMIAELARDSGAAIMAAGPRSEDTGEGRAEIFNSVFFFRPAAATWDTYDKVHLLPYIEFLPSWAFFFKGPEDAVSYRPGDTLRLFEAESWRIGPLICLEGIFPWYARDYGALGAELLVNVSNDSWFEVGGGAAQHFAMAVFRAAETRLPLVRVASTGISGAVDSTGRIVAQLPASRSEVRLVEISRGSGRSFYRRFGDVFAWLALIFAAVSLLLTRGKSMLC